MQHFIKEKNGRYSLNSETVSAEDVFQFAEQLAEKKLNKERLMFTESSGVKRYLIHALGLQERELFGVLFLNTNHEIISFEKDLFKGTIAQSAVYPREIIKKALSLNASAIILVHNHPSGNTEPSDADISITKIIQQVCEIVDIRVLDHFIVTNTDAVCLSELGHM